MIYLLNKMFKSIKIPQMTKKTTQVPNSKKIFSFSHLIAQLQKVPRIYLALLAFGFILFVGSVIGLIVSLMAMGEGKQVSDDTDFTVTRVMPSQSTIIVDIEGAVTQPGVYEIPLDSRLVEALKRAGGLKEGADKYYLAKNFNLAKKLTDEEKVYIPFNEESSISVMFTSEYNLVSINAASKTQLELLPNIGPVNAQKIMDNRPYSSLEDLINKKVIGNSLYQKIKSLISL